MDISVCVSVLGVGGGLGAIGLAYKLIRPRFPIRVNCWFCQEEITVPYGNRNCWDCPKCEQYNGFDEDGGYNKPIPAQHRSDLNHSVTGTTLRRGNDGQMTSPSILCEPCNRNQVIKVKQLANFVPFNEASYDAEMEAYRQHIEHVYRLCPDCEAGAQEELERQDRTLLTRMKPADREKLEMTAQSILSQSGEVEDWDSNSSPWLWVVPAALHSLSLLCVISLFLTHLPPFLHSQHIRLQGAEVLECPLVKIYSTSLVFLGLFLNIFSKLALGKSRIYHVDGLSCLSWLLLMFCHLFKDTVSQSECTLLLLCAVTIILTTTAALWRHPPRSNNNISVRRLSLDSDKLDDSDSQNLSSSVSNTLPFSQPCGEDLSRDLPSLPWIDQHPWDTLQQRGFNTSIITPSKAPSVFSEPVRRETTLRSCCLQSTDLNQSFNSTFSEPVYKSQTPQVFRHNQRSAFRVVGGSSNLTSNPLEVDDGMSAGHANEDIDLELDSINLGTVESSGMKKGVFSSKWSLRDFQSDAQSAVPSSLRERRPLISPAKLNAVKFRSLTPSGFSSSTGALFRNNFQSQRTLFNDKLSVTSHFHWNDRMSSIPNPSNSFKTSSVIGQKQDNSQSSGTSHSSFCPVDSTTSQYPENKKPCAGDSWWQSRYVIGGVLVCSIVTNLIVVYTAVLKQ